MKALTQIILGQRPGNEMVVHPIECMDGTILSVQASHYHYCWPRNDFGPYESMEVGYPTAPPPDSWRKYLDGDPDDDPCSSVYGYVPVELVEEFVALHGGEKGFTEWPT